MQWQNNGVGNDFQFLSRVRYIATVILSVCLLRTRSLIKWFNVLQK